jgi:hypothetical protein
VNDLIPLAVVIAIEPLPVIGFILVLSTEGGIRNGAAFIAAWLACLVTIIVATLALTGGEPVEPRSAPGAVASVVEIALGLALVGYAIWRIRRPPRESTPPAWLSRLDELRPLGAATLGVLLQPWPLVAAGAIAVLEADLSDAAAVAQLVAFALVATSSLLAMELYSIFAADRAGARLDGLRSWLDRHREPGITVIALVVGGYLIVEGGIALTRR